MNLFDWPLILPAFALLLIFRSRKRNLWLAPIFIPGLLLHFLFGVPRWQLVPAYLAATIVLLLSLRDSSMGHWVKVSWGLLVSLLMVAAVSVSWALPLFRLPAPTGLQAIGTQVEHWQDGTRPITVQMWYPTEQRSGPQAPYLLDSPVAAALAQSIGLPSFAFGHLRQVRTHAFLKAEPMPGVHPTLLFFHGLGGVRQQNTFQIEELASHGYVVVGIDMPGYAAATISGQGQVTANTHGSASLSNRLSDQWVSEWAQTGRFVLNQLLRDPQWRSVIDPARIGAFGHSFGGAAASYLLLTETRIRAALNMDAGIFGQPLPQAGYPRPFFLMNTAAGLDLTRLRTQAAKLTDLQISEATQGQLTTRSAYLNNLNELFERRRLALQGQTWSMVLPGTQHLSFSDLTQFSPLLAAGENVNATHTIVNAFTLAFFNTHLQERPVNLDSLRQRFPETNFQVGQLP